MAEFYNKGDQEIFKNFQFVPQEKYRTGFTAPGGQDASTPSFGITNTNAFTNSGGGETRYDNSFLPDLPQFNYVDMVRKYGADSKQAQQMLTKSGATYPGDFQSNEGGFEYTNSFPDNSIQMENLNNNYLNKGNTFQGNTFNTNIQDEKDMIAELAAQDANTKNIGFTYPNNNRFSTIKSQKNVFDVDVRGDPALNRGSKMAQGDDPYSEKAFQEEEDKKSFLSKMITRAKQMGSNLPGWAKVAATAMGGPFAAAASFLGNTGGKGYEQFDPRGNIKGGVYTMDGVNYANPSIVNESYDNDPSSPTYGTNRFDRAEPGSFASYRTLKDFFESKKDNKNTTTNNNDGGGGEGNSGDTESQTNSQAGVGGFADYAKGGRAGYFFGGRVNYKAGGRINFRGGGGQIGGTADMSGGNTPGPGDTGGEGGDNPTDNSDTQFGGGNSGDDTSNNPVDISTVTKPIGNYDIPYGLEALLANKGRFQAVINPDKILEENLGVDFTYDKGPYQVGFNADMEGNKNLGISYNKGDLSAYANTDFDNKSLGFKYSKTFANGGLASIL